MNVVVEEIGRLVLVEDASKTALVEEIAYQLVTVEDSGEALLVEQVQYSLLEAQAPQTVLLEETVYSLLEIGQQGPRGAPGTPGSQAVITESPSGVVDGTNRNFGLSYPPVFLILFKNGLAQSVGIGNDYTLSGQTVTFNVGLATPLPGDVLSAFYLH